MKQASYFVSLSAATSCIVAVLTVLALRASLPFAPSKVPPPLPQESPIRETVQTTVREESKIIKTIKEAEPAVVSVIVSKDLPVLEQYFEEGFPLDPFGGFFGDDFLSPFSFRIPRYREKGTERQEVGGGTAFFVRADGLLMTNKHVVSDEDAEYLALLNDGRKLSAKVAARHPSNDIALLQVEGENFPALTIADDEVKLGQTVIAIGNALGEFRNTVSVGVVSGLKRTISAGSALGGPVEHLESIIQTDAAINQGNSGGPLLNTRGLVVGMSTAIAAGAQNIAFAIPASELKRALESFGQHGRFIQAFIGVRYVPVTKELQEKNQLKYDYGALVLRGEEPTDLAVVPGSPANKAGIEENDIILEVDGQRVTLESSLVSLIRRKSPGDTITLKILHKEEEKEVKVVLEEMK